jgi:hypothetical protein
MHLRSQRKSRSEIPGQSCRALPASRWTRSCHGQIYVAQLPRR